MTQTLDAAPWLDLARREIGVREVAGPGSNPRILGYFRDAALPHFQDDAISWCAAFVGAMLRRTGLPNTGSGMARSYLGWGFPSPLRVGAIAVFPRNDNPAQGHVGFIVAIRGNKIDILGGNQSNMVCVQTRDVSELLPNGVRWPYPAAIEAPTVDDDLYEPATIQAPPPVAPEIPGTQQSVEERLREAGSRTLDSTDKIERAAKVGGVFTTLIVVVKQFFAELGVVGTLLLVGGVGAAAIYIWNESRKIRVYRVQDAANGLHVGR